MNIMRLVVGALLMLLCLKLMATADVQGTVFAKTYVHNMLVAVLTGVVTPKTIDIESCWNTLGIIGQFDVGLGWALISIGLSGLLLGIKVQSSVETLMFGAGMFCVGISLFVVIRFARKSSPPYV